MHKKANGIVCWLFCSIPHEGYDGLAYTSAQSWFSLSHLLTSCNIGLNLFDS